MLNRRTALWDPHHAVLLYSNWEYPDFARKFVRSKIFIKSFIDFMYKSRKKRLDYY